MFTAALTVDLESASDVEYVSSLNFATGTVGSDVESSIPQGWKVFSNTPRERSSQT